MGQGSQACAGRGKRGNGRAGTGGPHGAEPVRRRAAEASNSPEESYGTLLVVPQFFRVIVRRILRIVIRRIFKVVIIVTRTDNC